MKGNKILYAGAALAVLAIGFAAGTYAYYQNTITGTASGTVLAWNCTANNVGEDGDPFEINLGSLYPGSVGSAKISIASSIAADYKITLNKFTNIGTGSNHPNLNLYKDSAHATKLNESDTLTGSLAAGTATDVNLYYYWPYGTSKETYNASPFTVEFTILCSQK